MSRERLRSNAAALAYLKHMHDRWYRGQDTFGDTYNASLARLVMIGWMEGRLADFTSLGNDLRVSRQQATRRCLSMREAGWIEYKRKLGRIAVKPTDKLIAYAEVEIPKRLRLVLPVWQKIALMAGYCLLAGTTLPAVTQQVVAIEAAEEVAIDEVKRPLSALAIW